MIISKGTINVQMHGNEAPEILITEYKFKGVKIEDGARLAIIDLIEELSKTLMRTYTDNTGIKQSNNIIG